MHSFTPTARPTRPPAPASRPARDEARAPAAAPPGQPDADTTEPGMCWAVLAGLTECQSWLRHLG